MNKIKITLIKLGYVNHLANFRKLEKWRSRIFEISEIHCVEHLPDGDVNDFYLDQKFSIDRLESLIECPKNSDIAIAIMPYRFLDNFYMHGINKNCVIISLYGISKILEVDNISMENFILKQIYEICAIKYLVSDVSSEDVYKFVHRDTRGCIFDLNGEITDILYNTEKPIICESCKDTFKRKQVDSGIITLFNRELKRIKKPLILRVEKYIKKYPFASVILSALIAVSLNILASLIWDLITK